MDQEKMDRERWYKMMYRLNYSYVMYNFLQRVYGDFHYHVNILNAFFNCEMYYDDEKRYIQTKNTNVTTYLSRMHLRKQNPWTTLTRFLDEGNFLGTPYGIPTAQRFKEIVTADDRWQMSKAQENDYRDCIRKCIEECLDNGFAEYYGVGKDKLLLLNNASWHDDIQTFLFKLIENTLKWGYNDDLREISDSKRAEILLRALSNCDQLSVDKLLLHELDDNII